MSDQSTALKTMLADAILLGTRLARLRYAGPIHGEAAAGMRRSLEDLRVSTRSFLDGLGAQSLTDEDVFPLHDEIADKLSRRRDTCSQEKK